MCPNRHWRLARNLLSVYLFNAAWIALAVSPVLMRKGGSLKDWLVAWTNSWTYAVVIAPIAEETVFRLVGVGLLLAAFGRADFWVWVLAAFGSGYVFGIAHGDISNVFLQGVLGMSLAWLYIVTTEGYGGARRPAAHAVGLAACVVAHAAHNATVMLIVSLL